MLHGPHFSRSHDNSTQICRWFHTSSLINLRGSLMEDPDESMSPLKWEKHDQTKARRKHSPIRIEEILPVDIKLLINSKKCFVVDGSIAGSMGYGCTKTNDWPNFKHHSELTLTIRFEPENYSLKERKIQQFGMFKKQTAYKLIFCFWNHQATF